MRASLTSPLHDKLRFLLFNLFDKRNANRDALLVIDILLTEHMDESLFLIFDSVFEEIPCSTSEDDESDRIAEENSHANSPQEPAKVAGMTREGVQACGDKLVIVTSLILDRVGKVGACLIHADSTEALANEHNAEARKNDEPAGLHVGPDEMLEEVLGHADQPCDTPLLAVVDEETVAAQLTPVEKRHIRPLPHVIQRQHAHEKAKVKPVREHNHQSQTKHEEEAKAKASEPKQKIARMFYRHMQPYLDYENLLYVYPETASVKGTSGSLVQLSVKLINKAQNQFENKPDEDLYMYPPMYSYPFDGTLKRPQLLKESFCSVWSKERQFPDEVKIQLPLRLVMVLPLTPTISPTSETFIAFSTFPLAS